MQAKNLETTLLIKFLFYFILLNNFYYKKIKIKYNKCHTNLANRIEKLQLFEKFQKEAHVLVLTDQE